jgi:hypothetical protein
MILMPRHAERQLLAAFLRLLVFAVSPAQLVRSIRTTGKENSDPLLADVVHRDGIIRAARLSSGIVFAQFPVS